MEVFHPRSFSSQLKKFWGGGSESFPKELSASVLDVVFDSVHESGLSFCVRCIVSEIEQFEVCYMHLGRNRRFWYDLYHTYHSLCTLHDSRSKSPEVGDDFKLFFNPMRFIVTELEGLKVGKNYVF